MKRLAAVVLLACLASFCQAHAQPSDPRQTSCVLKLPGMDRAVVRTGIPFKKAGQRSLTFDLYLPPGSPSGNPPAGAKLPVVFFVNGVGDPPDAPLKEWGIYKDWGRLVAVSGMAAVVHNATPDGARQDLADVVDYVRSHAAELGIDPDNTALWACSANVGTGFPYAMDPQHGFLKAAVIYYGSMDPAVQRPDLPVLVGRAGLDLPLANRSIDAWVSRALTLNAAVTVMNLPNGRHAFDAFDDHDASRDVVKASLAFLKENLSPGVQAGRAQRALQARALTLKGAGRNDEAAEALAAWVKEEPGNGQAQWFLADVLYQLKRYAEAGAAYQKAGDQRVMPGLTLYNAACSYALAGDREKALTLLERAIGTGMVRDMESVRRDPDLASLHDDPRYRKLVGPATP